MGETTLSKTEAAVFRAWEGCSEDYGYLSFASVSRRSSVEPYKIRRAVRAIARKGLLQFGKGLWDDEGSPRGSGYGLTKTGRAYLDTITNPDSAPTPPEAETSSP